MQKCHSQYYFTYLYLQLMVYKRTITRFIADAKVVYQRMRWATRLASDNSWARRRLNWSIWARERCELWYSLHHVQWCSIMTKTVHAQYSGN